jgi:hypothetical protein
LDEIGNAEGCPLISLPEFMVHFKLSDEGELEFEIFGEATMDALFKLGYPLLDETLLDVPTDQMGNPTSEGQDAIRAAVAKERHRVRPRKVKEPDTELGRALKRLTRAPTRIVDRVVHEAAANRLNALPTHGKLN